ncbi:protein of unknown function [Franzmannia pantelleriensis]|uniref:DUF3541 domain-containing protein n=1 Tax=Franzmannia pantelleriensis TaxID=48727 RepID=A0A1G9I2T8_9GAMM|nr:DUF3541 domain-containing protein [Halomonas pantelleriensis]SDL19558.1 protein of unknown function [Halomonas pantelleriensis]
MHHAHPRGWLVVWLAIIWLTGCAASGPTATREDVAEAIQARYEAELFTLSPDKQRHYAQRLYRISGDARYVPLSESHAKRLMLRLGESLDGLALHDDYAARRSQVLLDAYPTRTARQRARRQMFADWDDMIYARRLLFTLIQLDYYGLLDAPRLAGHEPALDYLAQVDFAAFLTDPQVLSVYAAQVANIVHYLYQLGIVDLRDEVVGAFRQHYSPARVAALDVDEYRNRIYGMTHLVIADSRYYQREVSAAEHAWILEAFAAELPRILRDTTEDIMAEVGISFLLAGQQDHPAVTQLREAIVDAYDPQARMIPATDGSTDLERGEHRNVLAIMLLRWPEQLHPGPDLRKSLGQAPLAADSPSGGIDLQRLQPVTAGDVVAAEHRLALEPASRSGPLPATLAVGQRHAQRQSPVAGVEHAAG